MGFKSTTQSNSSQYQVNNLIFPSLLVYQTIKSIDRDLRILYSPAPHGSFWPTINYSPARDSVRFDQILDRVEIYIDEFRRKVKIIETSDSAFNEEFLGIVNFLYEASDFKDNTENDLSKQTEEYIKKRFISIADKFWKAGVHPLEF